jgi:AcrR family transcriptional regulator
MERNLTTEEKIKEAARRVFTQKGYAATRTRDIADECGVNLALLNYYFRSKEKLFDMVMLENMELFLQSVLGILNDTDTGLFDKIDLLVSHYIDMLMRHPDLPIFFLSEIKNDPERLVEKLGRKMLIEGSVLGRQWAELTLAGAIKPMNPIHLALNVVSMTIFPFVAQPILKYRAGIDSEQFNALMEERKKLIPQWIKGMLMAG